MDCTSYWLNCYKMCSELFYITFEVVALNKCKTSTLIVILKLSFHNSQHVVPIYGIFPLLVQLAYFNFPKK